MPEAAEDQDLLDALPIGVLLVSGERVRYLNAEAERLLELRGQHWRGQPLFTVLRDHRLERAYLEGLELECETRGRVLRAAPIPSGLSLLDVSAARRAQEEARELLAVLSHELRTPVAAIRATLEALGGELPEALRARFLARAEAESERLVRLLGDLTVEVQPPRYRSVALAEQVARAVSLVQPKLDEHRIRLEQRLAVETVWADADKLLQVLVNLLENAAVHGPDDAAVTLLAEPIPEMPELARLVVRDEGTPLAPETIERLFELHTRGRSAKAKGTGLGLYIVRSIAEAWGGAAWGRPGAQGNEFGVSVRLGPPG